ncbi:N/A [soil metagenome]
MAQQKKILFITPGAESFGGNIFLLNFLRWFKGNSSIPFVTLYGDGGDLSEDFAALSKTFQFNFSDKSEIFAKKAFGKLANHLELKRLWLKSQILKENIGLIYSNAVTNHKMLSMFADLEVPVITHCHELESLIQYYGVENFNYTKNKTSEFIAVSNAVRQNLIENHQISDDKIKLIYGFIPIEKFSEADVKRNRKMLCSELQIPENAFIVGASGTLNWNKAPEIFIAVARQVFRKNPLTNTVFVWIGGAKSVDYDLFRINYEIEKSDLKNKVFFLEHKSNPLDYYSAVDTFVSVSREDSFPLVCLESASFAKPILCFENAGGMPEFVGDDCGFVVPFMNTEIFAGRISELYENPDICKNLGENAARKVREDHDINISAPKVLEIIERFWD